MASKASKRRKRTERRQERLGIKPAAAAAVTEQERDGGIAVLQDPAKTSRDVALIHKAVKKRWPITETKAKKIIDRMMGIVEKESVSIATGEGVFECESTADKNAIAAAKAIQSMAAMNQKDEMESARKQAQPQTPQQTTINVGVNVDARIDERRNRAIAIAERFRNGTVLVADSTRAD